MFVGCPTAVTRLIATYLDLASHTRFARTSQCFAAVCAHRTASPVRVTLPRLAPDWRSRPRSYEPLTRTQLDPALDPEYTLRHYRPLRLTCSPGGDGSLDYLAQQSQLRDLELRAPRTDGRVGGVEEEEEEEDDIEKRHETLEFLAHTPALRSLRTDVACWRNDASAATSHLAAATALTELRLTDSIDQAWRNGLRRMSAPSLVGPASMRWAVALTQLEVLEWRWAPDLQSFRGLGSDGHADAHDDDDNVNDEHANTHPRLRSLRVEGIELACDVAPLQALSALRHLVLGTRLRIHMQFGGLERLPTALRRLRLETAVMTDLEPFQHLTRLTRLECACAADLQSLSPLGALVQLRALQLDRCFGVRSLAGLERLTRLERLEIGGATALEDCTALAQLPRLRAFTLTDVWRPELRDNTPPLRHLAHLALCWTNTTGVLKYAIATARALVERALGGRCGPVATDDRTRSPVVSPPLRLSRVTSAVVIADEVAASVKVPADSSARVFSATQYDAFLGRATHAGHCHALLRQAFGRGDSADNAIGDDTRDGSADDMCDRCACDLASGAETWSCVPCDFHLCERCAAVAKVG